VERRLAAIMFTDMVGYTVMTQKNEAQALELLKEQRELLRGIFPKHRGREIEAIGDAFLVEFASALDAVKCAVEIQSILKELNETRPQGKRIVVRIGIHLGDVIHEGKSVSGDAVNIASRIEPLASPGGVCLTAQIYFSVVNKAEWKFESLGTPHLKNVATPVEVFRICGFGESAVKGIEHANVLPKNRIAVLPFVNMSPDPADEYFAEGLTEELISTISNIAELSVISRTSTSRFKGGEKSVAEIGNELKAGSILEGSVRKADSTVRVTAQLIDANTDNHLWSKSYDGELKQVFALQAEIAKQVSSALSVSILSTEMRRINKEPTRSPFAYTLYLKGRYLWNRRGLEDIKKAAEYFHEAVKEDPTLAPGYVGLADCHYLLGTNWSLDVESNHEMAKMMTAKALELDPELAEGHATNAALLARDYKWREAEVEFMKAIELNRSYATANQWYAILLHAQLRLNEAREHLEKAIELDPLSPVFAQNLASQIFLEKRDCEKSVEILKKAVDLNPNLGSFHFQLMYFYGKLKKFEDARREAETTVKLLHDAYPDIGKNVQAELANLEGDRESVARLLPEIEAHRKEAFISAFGIARFYFYLGDKDKGFEWLERSYSERSIFLWFIASDPELDNVRSDPRYFQLLEKMGLGFLKNSNLS
jgi:adenylate cyclase